MSKNREFDVIIFGASGFTGRLVAEYFAATHGNKKWAIAGRNAEKLKAVAAEVGVPDSVPALAVDADDEAALADIATRTKVILTTVGPYQLYGNKLLKACVEAGTGYVDLCGEPAWMAAKIREHQDRAKETGAHIVFSCGFDSIPSDLGVLLLQETAKEKLGSACPRVAMRVEAMNGTFSGGTAASFKATMAAAQGDPQVFKDLVNPFALCEGFEGPEQPRGDKPYEENGIWVAPFIMGSINTKAVHRSNFVLGHAYGEDFVYDEMAFAGTGAEGEAMAQRIAGIGSSMAGSKAPKPGEGPSKEEREAGNFSMLFIGTSSDGSTIKARVTADKDPGYGATSKMITEAALCLAEDVEGVEGGFYTPASLLGMPLIERLRARAGMTFEVV